MQVQQDLRVLLESKVRRELQDQLVSQAMQVLKVL
jgi:hypothetical protein